MMKDETDFAMKYSEERKMRMKVEERLYGLIYEVIAQHGATCALIEGIVTQNQEATQEAIRDLTDWRVDLESNIYLNLFKGAGKKSFLKPRHLKYGCLEDLPDNGFKKLRDATEVFARKNNEEWVEFAQENNLTPNGMIRQHYRMELLQLIAKGKIDEVISDTKH